MSEVVVGAWNALNAFGDEERVEDALRVVERMDADVLYMSEMALRDAADSDANRYAMDELEAMGYHGAFSNYSPPETGARDEHVMSMWTRGSEPVEHGVAGDRYTYATYVRELDMEVRGVHLSDQHKAARTASAMDIAQDILGNEQDGVETVIMGDFNDEYSNGPRARAYRVAGNVARRLVGSEIDFYDNSKKLQRIAGKIIRIGEMAEGKALEVLAEAGLTDADSKRRPTIGRGPVALQLDRVMVTPGLKVVSFTHHKQTGKKGRKISDHTPISATLRRR